MSASGGPGAREMQVDALIAALAARYPGRFDAAQTEQIRRSVSQFVDLGAQLREYPLTNADEPDPVFRAFRREE